MSDFVQFPEAVYTQAGNVFAAFAATAPGFTLANAKAMMWFSQLAYEVDTSGSNSTAAKIDRIRTLWDFQPVTTFRARAVSPVASFDTTGVFGERADAVLLSFAGTDPAVWETLATDFNPRIGPDNTHVGFQAAMNAVTNDVRSAIALSQQRNKPLFISGHSLGGALAALAARFAVAQNRAPRAVYVYGMPRTGDMTFQAAYHGVLGRVPPAAIGYRHVGHVLQCDPTARFVAAQLTAQVSNDPDVTLAYLQQIMSIPGAAGALAGLVTGGIGPQNIRTAFAQLLQPPGNGPLGQWFKFLPPPIRDHLQDQYIGAL
jgi:triacylglycerol lipase